MINHGSASARPPSRSTAATQAIAQPIRTRARGRRTDAEQGIELRILGRETPFHGGQPPALPIGQFAHAQHLQPRPARDVVPGGESRRPAAAPRAPSPQATYRCGTAAESRIGTVQSGYDAAAGCRRKLEKTSV